MTGLISFISKRRALYLLASLVAIALGIALFGPDQFTHAHDQDVLKLNRLVQTTSPKTPAMKIFRDGRDFIEREDWQSAAERFRSFLTDFPKDRQVDAALYWYAYSLQKLGRKDEAAEPLLRLIREFASSSWRREAEAMLVVLGRGEAVQQALQNRNNCEIKILALQSLFQANEERAFTFVNEVLKSNQTDCPALQAAAVSLLGSYGGARATPLLLDIARGQGDLRLRLTAIRRLGDQNLDAVADDLARLYDADRTKEIRVQILRALAQMQSPRAQAKLIELARAGDDPGMRLLAIRYLGDKNAAGAVEELIRLYDAERTPDIRTQIVRSLAASDDPKARAKLVDIARRGESPEIRIEAIRRLGNSPASVEELLKLYATENDQAIKQGLIRAYADLDDPRAQEKLHAIARSGETLDLRAYAIRQLGNRNDSQTVDQLVAMYDAEADVKVKAALIRAFGDSNQKSALNKLMAIARSDQSVDLRKLAVRYLGDSKDPDALKFLEELLK